MSFHIDLHSTHFIRLTTLLILLLPFFSWCQNTFENEDIRIQQADFRGKGYEVAGRAAFQASKNDVVVVLLCKADHDVIQATQTELKVLSREGYNRVAIILSDAITTTDDKHPVVAIIVNNENPFYMTGVSVHAEYQRDLYQSVRQAYRQYILAQRSND